MKDDDKIARFVLDPANPPDSDWRAFDAMTEEERHAAALSDPDCLPAPEEKLARFRRAYGPDLHCVRQSDEQRARDFALLEEISAAFDDVSPDEIEREVAAAVAEVRAEPPPARIAEPGV